MHGGYAQPPVVVVVVVVPVPVVPVPVLVVPPPPPLPPLDPEALITCQVPPNDLMPSPLAVSGTWRKPRTLGSTPLSTNARIEEPGKTSF